MCGLFYYLRKLWRVDAEPTHLSDMCHAGADTRPQYGGSAVRVHTQRGWCSGILRGTPWWAKLVATGEGGSNPRTATGADGTPRNVDPLNSHGPQRMTPSWGQRERRDGTRATV
jgi:hypothetical protein